ncbi:MAG: type IV toxin-antitoxin system AbiEi family antitoxin domain-containing protein [Candidatus Binataceae bacterium]
MGKFTTKRADRQQDQAVALLKQRGMVRLAEFRAKGVTAATISRLERAGAVVRLGRGVYQLPDAAVDAHHVLAEASKRVPRGVICLVSALAFHDLTDQLPARVWMAIGAKAWRPRIEYPAIRFVRFPKERLEQGVEFHVIDGVKVPIFGAAKTVADVFRYRRVLGTTLAAEGLREALRKKKATPAEISEQAVEAGVWTAMQPYLEALTLDG